MFSKMNKKYNGVTYKYTPIAQSHDVFAQSHAIARSALPLVSVSVSHKSISLYIGIKWRHFGTLKRKETSK